MCEYLIYRRLHGHCSTTLADDLEDELRVRDNNPSQERNWQRSEQCRVQRRGRPHETNLLRVHTIEYVGTVRHRESAWLDTCVGEIGQLRRRD